MVCDGAGTGAGRSAAPAESTCYGPISYGDCGLVGSAVARSLSQRLSDGEDGDLELLWDGERHVVRRVTFGGDDADKFLCSLKINDFTV